LATADLTVFSNILAAFWGMNFKISKPDSTGRPLTAPIILCTLRGEIRACLETALTCIAGYPFPEWLYQAKQMFGFISI
jgi:hypothetical protein